MVRRVVITRGPSRVRRSRVGVFRGTRAQKAAAGAGDSRFGVITGARGRTPGISIKQQQQFEASAERIRGGGSIGVVERRTLTRDQIQALSRIQGQRQAEEQSRLISQSGNLQSGQISVQEQTLSQPTPLRSTADDNLINTVLPTRLPTSTRIGGTTTTVTPTETQVTGTFRSRNLFTRTLEGLEESAQARRQTFQSLVRQARDPTTTQERAQILPELAATVSQSRIGRAFSNLTGQNDPEFVGPPEPPAPSPTFPTTFGLAPTGSDPSIVTTSIQQDPSGRITRADFLLGEDLQNINREFKAPQVNVTLPTPDLNIPKPSDVVRNFRENITEIDRRALFQSEQTQRLTEQGATELPLNTQAPIPGQLLGQNPVFFTGGTRNLSDLLLNVADTSRQIRQQERDLSALTPFGRGFTETTIGLQFGNFERLAGFAESQIRPFSERPVQSLITQGSFFAGGFAFQTAGRSAQFGLRQASRAVPAARSAVTTIERTAQFGLPLVATGIVGLEGFIASREPTPVQQGQRFGEFAFTAIPFGAGAIAASRTGVVQSLAVRSGFEGSLQRLPRGQERIARRLLSGSRDVQQALQTPRLALERVEGLTRREADLLRQRLSGDPSLIVKGSTVFGRTAGDLDLVVGRQFKNLEAGVLSIQSTLRGGGVRGVRFVAADPKTRAGPALEIRGRRVIEFSSRQDLDTAIRQTKNVLKSTSTRLETDAEGIRRVNVQTVFEGKVAGGFIQRARPKDITGVGDIIDQSIVAARNRASITREGIRDSISPRGSFIDNLVGDVSLGIRQAQAQRPLANSAIAQRAARDSQIIRSTASRNVQRRARTEIDALFSPRTQPRRAPSVTQGAISSRIFPPQDFSPQVLSPRVSPVIRPPGGSGGPGGPSTPTGGSGSGPVVDPSIVPSVPISPVISPPSSPVPSPSPPSPFIDIPFTPPPTITGGGGFNFGSGIARAARRQSRRTAQPKFFVADLVAIEKGITATEKQIREDFPGLKVTGLERRPVVRRKKKKKKSTRRGKRR